MLTVNPDVGPSKPSTVRLHGCFSDEDGPAKHQLCCFVLDFAPVGAFNIFSRPSVTDQPL